MEFRRNSREGNPRKVESLVAKTNFWVSSKPLKIERVRPWFSTAKEFFQNITPPRVMQGGRRGL